MAMRVVVVATIFLLSSGVVPTLAQEQGKVPTQSQPETAPAPTQSPQTVPVQPERTPQQSEQARKQGQDRSEDVQVGPDWRTQSRDGDKMDRMGKNGMGRMMEGMGPMGQSEMARMMDHMRMCRRMMEHWGYGMHRDSDDMDSDEGRGDRSSDRANRNRYSRSYDEGRSPRRVKICIEDENGDEYCRYRDR
jgi:hypothetical protein